MTDYYDDEEFEYQQSKEQMQKLLRHQQRFQAEQEMETRKQEANQLWKDALKEQGISEEAYNSLVQQDPQFINETYKQQVREFASKVARRRDPKTGRFVKGSSPQREMPKHHKEQPSVMGHGNRQAFEEKYSDYKNRRGTDDEVKDMVEDFIPADFWKYR